MKHTKTMVTAVLIGLSAAAFADSTWYTSGSGANYNDNYVIRYAYWKDRETTAESDWPVATRDYILGGPREYIVANGVQSAKGFAGKSLQVGNNAVTPTQFAKVYFNGNGTISCTGTGGLILSEGFFENWQAGGWMNVLGKVTVTSTSNQPFWFMHAKDNGGGVRFADGSLNGNANAHMLVTCRYNRSNIRTATLRYPMRAAVYSSLAGYYGTLEFDDGLTNVALGGIGVTAGGTTCPGNVLIASTNTIDIAGSASNTVSIAHLTLGTDIAIKVVTANTNGVDICSCLEVTDTLTMPDDAPIKVVLSGSVGYVSPDKLPVRKFAFMRVKKSVKELAIADFVIDDKSFAPALGSLNLYDGAKVGIDYDESTDMQTVYFELARIYTLNTSSFSNSAFRKTFIDYWNGHAAGDDFDTNGIYLASQKTLTLNVDELQPDGGWVMPGRRLVVNNNTDVVLGGSTAKYHQIDALVMRATSHFLNWGIGAKGYWNFGPNESYLNSLVWGVFKGTLTLAPYKGGWEWVSFISSGHWNDKTQTGTPRGYVLDMDIHTSGSRPLLAIGSNDSSIHLTSYIGLAGDNSDMKCPILVQQHCNSADLELGPQLLFWQGKNLGGYCSDNVGIWLAPGTTLWALDTTAIEAVGRTLYIGHEDAKANVKVSSGKTLTLKNDFNLAGEMRKRGEGNFALGGVFHSCTGNLVKLSVPVRDSNRRVTVEEGSIEGAHVDCLRDALVSFKPGTSLMARKPADDASSDFKTYGIRGRCDGIWNLFDFTTSGNLDYVPVKVVVDPEHHMDDYSFPLFTVSATEAASMSVKVQRVNPAGEKAKGLAVRVDKSVNADGSVTFVATVQTTGLAVYVR